MSNDQKPEVEPTATMRLQDYMLADMKRKTDSIREGLDLIEKTDSSTINEIIFVRDFLPLFAGETKDNLSVLLDYWYTIAGSPYRPVNVVDGTGKFIIQVPPILDRNSVAAKPNSGELAGMLEMARQRAVMSANGASMMVANDLNERFTELVSQEVNSELALGWKKLLEHYNKTNKPNSNNKTPTAEVYDFED